MEMENLKSILEKVLREHEKDAGLTITTISQESCNPGDNFMSDACAVEAVGTTGSDTPYSCALFLKRLSESKERRDLCHMENAFNNETITYLKIFPLIPYISQITPECLFAREEIIVMKNLQANGYKMADKSKGLDLAHAELVMKATGKLHAGTYNIRVSKGDNEFNNLLSGTFNFILQNDLFISLLDSAVEVGVKNLKLAEDDSLDGVINKLEDSLRSGKSFNILKKMQQSESLSLICHGDLWINNILFRYDEEDIVSGIKLIDFQFIRKCSLAVDLWTFLYTSISPELLNSKYDYLISVYSTSFIDSLKALNISEKKIPAIEDIKAEIDSREIYGFFIALWYLPGVLREWTESSVELETAFQSKDSIISSFHTVNTLISQRLTKLAKRCIERGVL